MFDFASLPSRFIAELPVNNTEHMSNTGLMGAGIGGWGSRLQETNLVSAPDTGDQGWKTNNQTEGHELTVGMRIFHQKFGYGIIKVMENSRLEIAFDKAGRKKVLSSFVEPV